MKKTKPGIAGIHEPEHLFRGVALRRHRTLILPRYLNDEAFRLSNRSAEIDIAHAIILRWADLESNGHLAGNETTLDDSFRQEVFGQALNYRTATTSPQAYYYAKGFFITGIGPPDGVLGNFPPVEPRTIRAVIELKDAATDLDHDKFNGRTPVQQCWDYLNNLPDCPCGIVSNFVSFRLYHRDKTQQAFEHFELQKLRDREQFTRFWALFERGGLIANHVVKSSRTKKLIAGTEARRRQVAQILYDYSSEQRLRLIALLRQDHGKHWTESVRITQSIFDRIMFVAFCEAHGLLPAGTLGRCAHQISPCPRASNPRWRNFLDLFEALRSGHANLENGQGFQHALFSHDPAIDSLQLDDRWALMLAEFDAPDYRIEVPPRLIAALFRAASAAISSEFREFAPIFQPEGEVGK